MNKFDQFFYIRITESCNLRCDHCFIPANPKNMKKDNFDMVLREIHAHTSEKDNILIQLHGGEPTLAGVTKTEQLITMLKGDKSRNYSFSIQTNLINLNDLWIDLYKRHFDSEVGVSWDYEIRKKDGSFDKFEEIFWPNLKKLTDAGIEPNLVVTATKPFLEWMMTNATDFFDKLVEHNVQSLQLERLTKVGWARNNWDLIGMTNKQYSEYMSIVYYIHKMYILETENSLYITPFDSLERDVHGLLNGTAKQGSGCLSGVCDSKFHTIDSNGYKVGCTALNSEVDNASNNNVAISFFEPSDILKERKERVADCVNCEFNKICNTGCLSVTKTDISGECSGSYNLLKTIKKCIENEQ